MKNLILSVLLLIILGEVFILYLMNKGGTKENVLAEATVVVTPAPTPTEIPTPTPTITPKPTPVKTPTPIPQPTVSSQQINEFIERFASQYGVDPNVIRYIALCESGFNPKASHVGYAGLFQFGSITWKNIRKEIGEDNNPDLRYNAEEAVQTVVYAISKGKRALWPNCYP
jgi:hypothetical protein